MTVPVLALLLASPAFAADEAAEAAPAPEAAEASDVSATPGLPADNKRRGSDAFAVKTMRNPLPAREVERGLLLPKGWLELSLGYDHKIGTGAWTAAGEKELFEHARWTYRTEKATLRYGLGPRVELWWQLPFHQAQLTNDLLGTDTRDGSIGDPRFGARFELMETEAPTRSVALELAYKGPAAQETPGTYIGGPLNMSQFVFTTGTPDLSVGIGAKQQAGPIAVTAHLGYVRRFSAVVQYLVELENLQFLGRMKPGDQVVGDLHVGVQAGPAWLYAGPRFELRGETRIGTTSAGLSPSKQLDAVEGSDGKAVDLDVGAVLGLSRGVDVVGYARLPVAGEDLQFFPIEDLQPTYGPTFGGALELRY